MTEIEYTVLSSARVGTHALGDWWWVGSRRLDGRSGHAYTCPLLMTLTAIFRRWILRQDCRWRVGATWGLTDDEYEPARVSVRPEGRSHTVKAGCIFPDWMIRAECAFLNWKIRCRAKKPMVVR